jgi:hypothetical protein
MANERNIGVSMGLHKLINGPVHSISMGIHIKIINININIIMRVLSIVVRTCVLRRMLHTLIIEIVPSYIDTVPFNI